MIRKLTPEELASLTRPCWAAVQGPSKVDHSKDVASDKRRSEAEPEKVPDEDLSRIPKSNNSIVRPNPHSSMEPSSLLLPSEAEVGIDRATPLLASDYDHCTETPNPAPAPLTLPTDEPSQGTDIRTDSADKPDDSKAAVLPLPKETAPQEDSEEDLQKYLDPQAEYHPVAFADPLEMLETIYAGGHSIYSGAYPWQKDELLRLSLTSCTPKEPLRMILSANNGSGKDSFINAPIAIFLAMCMIRSRTVLTTASYTQLQLQTEAYIRSVARQANNFFAKIGIEKMFIIKKEHIVCTQTGSEIIMFVTDDAGRAEGYHPFPDYPDGQVTIIINEAKTVPDIIFEALSRCTYSRWLEISSPGKTSGKHYIHVRAAVEYPAPYSPGKFYFRRITSLDCPHISASKIESDRLEYGENSAIFRSKHLALFTSLDEQVVITKESLDQALLFPYPKLTLGTGKRAGLDLAGGGDENALVVFDENKCIGTEYFRAKDTAEVTIPVLIDFFKKYGLTGDNIYADDGGVGQGILDGLRRAGYDINRVLNQSSASQKGQYGNRGAELWFRFGQFAQYIIYPEGDDKLISQLANRYYKQAEGKGTLLLESKPMARSKGHGSPDRADACVLAWTGITVHTFLEALGKVPKIERSERRVLGSKELATKYQSGEARRRLTLPNDLPRITAADLLAAIREVPEPKKLTFNNPGRLLRELYR